MRWEGMPYINVTPVRASPAALDVDISQMQDSCQDPEELHLLVGPHTCRFSHIPVSFCERVCRWGR